MFDGSSKNIGDRLNAAVRMPRETGEVIARDVVAEIVQQEKRVEVGCVAEAERPAQMHAGAFEGRLGLDQSLNGSNGHIVWLVSLQGVVAPTVRPKSEEARRNCSHGRSRALGVLPRRASR